MIAEVSETLRLVFLRDMCLQSSGSGGYIVALSALKCFGIALKARDALLMNFDFVFFIL